MVSRDPSLFRDRRNRSQRTSVFIIPILSALSIVPLGHVRVLTPSLFNQVDRSPFPVAVYLHFVYGSLTPALTRATHCCSPTQCSQNRALTGRPEPGCAHRKSTGCAEARTLAHSSRDGARNASANLSALGDCLHERMGDRTVDVAREPARSACHCGT